VLSLSIKLVGPEFIRLRVGGNLDVTTVPTLELTLDRVAARTPWRLELELSRLRMIDTVGLGALVRFSKRLKGAGCLVHVGGLRDQPLLVFRLLGLDRQLGLAGDLPCD
jgi:anti-sigma B factor antagonist